MKVILDSKQIEKILKDLAGRIVTETPRQADIAAIGIRSRGEILAQRLSGSCRKCWAKMFRAAR